MLKQRLAIEELTVRVLAEIRQHRGGEDVAEISIYEIADSRAGQNWSVSIVKPGRGGPGAASRAAIDTIRELGQRYDLLPDD
jgi:hypothetical protein